MAARMSSTSAEKKALQELANSVVHNYVSYSVCLRHFWFWFTTRGVSSVWEMKCLELAFVHL